MTTIQRSIIIKSSVEQVDAIASDPKRWPEWYENIEKVEIDSVFPEVGGVVEMTYNVAGILFKVRFIQNEYIPANRSVCKIDGRFKGATRFMLTEEDEGTRASLAIKYKMPGGVFLGFANNIIVKDRIKENLENSLKNLKDLVESEV